MAMFFSEFSLFGKFETEEELNTAYHNWTSLTESTDWILKTE